MASMAVVANTVGCGVETIKGIHKFERETGLHFTTEHSGKMRGTMSLSTLCDVNPLCIERMKNGNSICAHCFSHRQWKMYGEKSARKFAANYEILNENGDKFPVIDLGDVKYFRGESFGDSASWKHPAYFIRLALANKGTQIALWTKNPWFVREAVEKLGLKRKPSNLQVILSSVEVNKPDVKLSEKYADVVDKRFTVYTKEYLAEHPEVKVNCGAKNCHYNCGYRCYKRAHTKGIVDIREKEK